MEPVEDKFVQIGVDIGQRTDPTALSVTEVETRENEAHFLARHLERLALGTSYPDVVRRLVEIHETLSADGCDARLWIDATGVGAPVVDLIAAAGLPVTAVYLTGGEQERWDGGALYLPKLMLVSRLQVLLQTRRVHLPDTGEARALAQELQNFEIRFTDAANVQAGAFQTGSHDDLVVSLGLACREPARMTLYALSW